MNTLAVLRVVLTLVLIVLFLAMTVATFSRRRKSSFDAAARLALDDGEILQPGELRK